MRSPPSIRARAKPFETMTPERRSTSARQTRCHSRGPAFLPSLSTGVKVPMNNSGLRASDAVVNGCTSNAG